MRGPRIYDDDRLPLRGHASHKCGLEVHELRAPDDVLAGPDDPDPSRSWEVYASDNFDRDSPASADVTGHGIIPGLMELWVSLNDWMDTHGRKCTNVGGGQEGIELRRTGSAEAPHLSHGR